MEVQYCKWVHVIEVLVYRTTWCLLRTAAEEFRKPNFCYILRKNKEHKPIFYNIDLLDQL